MPPGYILNFQPPGAFTEDLLFFAPAVYRRWIAGGEALTGAVEGS